jgi:VIT1/CCC1 family predicted Fe2+/Mn2+ transporter
MDIDTHLSQEHKISPLASYLREIVYGGLDGIVTTFAVVAGFAGAQQPQLVALLTPVPVLLFGLANLFADGVSMSLGNFLSLRSEKDVYAAEKAKERHKIRTSPALELEETVAILKHRGYSGEDAKDMAALYAKNEDFWTYFMMHDELALPNPERQSALSTSLVTFASFVSFGAIPLVPYILSRTSASTFTQSIFFTITALLTLGLLRWRVNQERLVRSMGETLLLGSVAAFVAYLVGTFFRPA